MKGFVAKITEVTQRHSQWQILFSGAPPPPPDPSPLSKLWPQPYDPEGTNNRKATVILSDNYEVLEVLGDDLIKKRRKVS